MYNDLTKPEKKIVADACRITPEQLQSCIGDDGFLDIAKIETMKKKPCPNCGETIGTYSLGNFCKNCHQEI